MGMWVPRSAAVGGPRIRRAAIYHSFVTSHNDGAGRTGTRDPRAPIEPPVSLDPPILGRLAPIIGGSRLTSRPHASPRIPWRPERRDARDRRAPDPGADRMRRRRHGQLLHSATTDHRGDLQRRGPLHVPAGERRSWASPRSRPRTPRAWPAPTRWPTPPAWRCAVYPVGRPRAPIRPPSRSPPPTTGRPRSPPRC